jgi:hypothetical protein
MRWAELAKEKKTTSNQPFDESRPDMELKNAMEEGRTRC